MLSDISVRRPVFAAVAAIILCVIGLAAFMSLPVRELPNVDPPVVSITTNYRGASAEVGVMTNRFDGLPSAGTIWSGSIFVGADTFAGPAYIGFGLGEAGRWSLYLLLGAP